MYIDLAPHIYTLLFQQETVIFPEFGGLVGSYKPASVDYVQGIIYPPSKVFMLNERLITNDGVLEHFVRNKFELTGEEAKLVISNYVVGMKERLEKGEIVLFPKVGRLYRNYERKLQFLQETTNFNKDSYGLPSIQFYPILRSSEKKASSEAPAPVVEKKMVGKAKSMAKWVQAAMPIMIGCAVVSIAISLYFISPVSQQEIAATLQTLPVSESTRFNRKPDISQAGLHSNFEEQDRHTNITTVEEDPEIIIPEEEEPTIETESITYAPSTQECVIIIGAFSKKTGVRTTVEKIYDLGYDAYQDKKGNLTRVGVQFAYDSEKDIERTLRQIKAKINRKAWVFKK